MNINDVETKLKKANKLLPDEPDWYTNLKNRFSIVFLSLWLFHAIFRVTILSPELWLGGLYLAFRSGKELINLLQMKRTFTETALLLEAKIESSESDPHAEHNSEIVSRLLEAERIQRTAQTTWKSFWYGLSSLFLFSVTLFRKNDMAFWGQTIPRAGCILVAASAIGYIAYQLRIRSASRALIEPLRAAGDVRYVPVLIRSLAVPKFADRARVKNLLTELLPKLKASDSRQLGPTERSILIECVLTPQHYPNRYSRFLSLSGYTQDLDFRLAILSAFKQIGGHQEFESIGKLARREVSTGLAEEHPKKVYDAARRCMPFLKDRAKNAETSSEIVRPSSADSQVDHTLLRSAISTTKDNADELVRVPGNTPSTRTYEPEEVTTNITR